MKNIALTPFDRGNQRNVLYDKEPNVCPFCHDRITPRRHNGIIKDDFVEILFGCSSEDCGRLFVSQYELNPSSSKYEYKSSSIGTTKERTFSSEIEELSLNFVEIYNESAKAESLGLGHIAGIGYRKALEFLLKDYLIKLNPEQEEIIKKKFLGKCIQEDIQNANLLEISKRAVWLGNDESHYVRKWEDKDVSDLKKLIDVSLHWIEMEILTEQYTIEM